MEQGAVRRIHTASLAFLAFPMLLCAFAIAPQLAMCDPLPSAEDNAAPATPAVAAAPAAVAPAATAPICATGEIVINASEPQQGKDSSCAPPPTSLIADARAYLIGTAHPGGTMMRQGPDVAIGRLHPEFVVRLARAIREARDAGLSEAGIFSAYRPPAFGVGGFIDKFNSLHSYGLAVDVYGIGASGSPGALRWHEIAAKHGIVCPYGPLNPVEWNHCQSTRVTIVRTENPLRETITADGPIDLEGMFEVGNSVIVNMKDAAVSIMPGYVPPVPLPLARLMVGRPLGVTAARPPARGIAAGPPLRGVTIVINERLRGGSSAKIGAA
jgi:hypothetical protein